MDQKEVEQIAKQAVQAASQDVAAQVAKQVAQQVGESISQAISKLMQSQTQSFGSSTVEKEIGETGMAERAQLDNADRSGVMFANVKRTYDEYQDVSLKAARHFDAVALQAVQNAVETANMLSKKSVENMDAQAKQHLAHRDIATDNLWNPVQIAAGDTLAARAVSLDDVSLKAIGAAVAAAIAESLKK